MAKNISPFVIRLASKEGQKLLQECRYDRLLPYFCKQVNFTNCGPCSAAICLNAILENCSGQNSFHQGNFSELVRIKDRKKTLREDDILKIGEESSLFRKEDVENEGITLQTFFELIKIIGLQASFYHVFRSPQETSTNKNYLAISSVDEFRSIALEYLEKPQGHVVVNYFLGAFYPGSYVGHFSPLGGYHVAEDRFLLLDVWPANAVGWVTTEHLFNAMVPKDSTSHLPRGFCVFNADNALQENYM